MGPGTIDGNAEAEAWNGLMDLASTGGNAASAADVAGGPAGPVPVIPLSGTLYGMPKLVGTLASFPRLALAAAISL